MTLFLEQKRCAELHYNLYNTTRGLVLKVGGYSHKLGELLSAQLKVGGRLLDKIASLRGEATLDYANFWRGQPYAVADYTASATLETPKWHVREYQAFLADESRCSAATLREFAERRLFADGIDVDVLVHGNATEEDARAYATLISESLLHPGPAGGVPLATSRQPSARCVRLPKVGGGVRHISASNNKDESNAALDLTLQLGPANPKQYDLTLQL
ncbi:hypothetical protein T492DRAFT_842347 [Pavlovales sp. CCMP2436]|nr:hypothetical protein T492DRAFT_842347 [Pavlovales sp. CCMP2436]